MFQSVIDLVRYSRLELRDLPVPCIPKGPNFNWGRTIKVLVAGNELKLRLPRHAPRSCEKQFRINGDVVHNNFSVRPAQDVMADDCWEFFEGIFRQWRFNGPWFSGDAGAVNFCFQVVEPVEPYAKVSFFHPNVFEQALTAYLSSRFEHKENDGRSLWQGPVNWSRRDCLPVFSACFDVLPVRAGAPVHYYVFPVGDHYLAEITFTFDQACAGFMAEKDQKINREPMWELVNNILGSMTLTLSPENQAKVDKIRAECPAYALSETFPPLQWLDAGHSAPAEILSAPPG